MTVQDFKWQGQPVQGTVESQYVTSRGTRYFVKLTEPVDDEFMSSREGHNWPIVGSIILADA